MRKREELYGEVIFLCTAYKIYIRDIADRKAKKKETEEKRAPLETRAGFTRRRGNDGQHGVILQHIRKKRIKEERRKSL